MRFFGGSSAIFTRWLSMSVTTNACGTPICDRVERESIFGQNDLKRHVKPLAESAGVHAVTHQAFRRTSSTHIQNHATVKDMQRHLRHRDPQTTLKHYAKVIPESLRAAVAALDEKMACAPATRTES